MNTIEKLDRIEEINAIMIEMKIYYDDLYLERKHIYLVDDEVNK